MSSSVVASASTAITHINQLPNEILAHIFSFCEYEKHNCAVLLNLACACKHWHDILWSFPRFWTTQSLSVPMKLKNEGPHAALLPTLCNHLERWYGRAGDVPRDLSLSFGKPNSRTLVLYNYFTGGTRWKTLSFSFDLTGASNWIWLEGLISTAHQNSLIPDPKTGEPKPCWRDLTKLEILTPSIRYDPERLLLPLEHISPNLTHLKVHICELRTSIFSVFASSPNAFANLTTFDWKGELGTESLAFYIHLLSTAPKLEVFRSLDEQHDFDGARALPEQYAKLVPLRHDVLKEVRMHWSPNAAVLLKSIALPGLKTLDLLRSYDPSHIERPPDDATTVADAVKALILNSTKASTGMAIAFGLRTLRLKRNPLVENDLFEVVMAVREMVEELVLDRSACWWHKPETFFRRLDNLVHGRSKEQDPQSEGEQEALPATGVEPLDLFPNLKTLTVVPDEYNELSFTVSQTNAEEYGIFKSSPSAWWSRCKAELDEAEKAAMLDDSWEHDSDLDEYQQEGEWSEEIYDEDEDEADWKDEGEDMDAIGDEDEDEDEDEDDEDAIGTWQLATMTIAPHRHYED